MDALPGMGLPACWASATLGELCDVIGGITVDAKRGGPGHVEVPYLRVANVQRGRLDLAKMRTILVPEAKLEALTLQHGDVLLNEGGDRDKVGRGWVWEGQLPQCVFQNHVFRARVRNDVVCPYYLSLYLNEFGRDYFLTGAKQTTNLASISLSAVKGAPVVVPPRAEQARIVAEVNALFEEVEIGESALAQAREGLVQFRASLLHAACTGAFSGEGGDGWQMKPLAELISEGPKNGYSPKAGDNENGTLALKLTATTSGRLNLAPHAVKRLSETIPPGSPLYLRSGDLLFQRGNTPEYVGIAAIYDGPQETYVYPDLMIRVRSPDPALTAWIWRVSNAPAGRRHMRNAASGTAGSMPKITGAAVRSLPIPLPPREEMLRLLDRIAEELNTADEAEAVLQAQQAAAVELRHSVLHAAFTGRLVPQDPADEPAAALLARLRATLATPRRPRTRRTAAQPELIEMPA